MANYEVLEPGGHAALVDGLKDYADRAGGTDTEQLADGSVNLDKLDEDVLDVLDTKADIDGYYAQLTAGTADNLTARGDAVEASFIRRTSGGINDIESGNATIKSIKGNTIRWNQLLNTWSGTTRGITFSGTNGKETASGTADTTGNTRITSAEVVVGHKYFVNASNLIYGSSNTAVIRYYHTNSFSISRGIVDTTGWTAGDRIGIGISYTSGEAVDLSFYPQLFDLTAMFGAGNEPETVAEFEALYPEPYYAYNAGSLLPVTMTGIATDGFNQWDEEWEVGGIYPDVGSNNNSATNHQRSKNYIPVFPNTTYYIKCPAQMNLCFYDSNKTYLGISNIQYKQNQTFNTPADAHYMRFTDNGANGWVGYNHDICINLSWSGRRNGEYEPYWSAQRAIDIATYFPTGLKKAGTVYDELTATEAIQRVGVVDLGTLTWSTTTLNGEPVFYNVFNASSAPANNNLVILSCDRLAPVSANDLYTNATARNIISINTSKGLQVRHDAADAATFKTAMSGVMLYYALATPVVTPIDSINLTYKVDDWGTETITGPLGAAPDMDIIYGMNAVDTIRRLPDLYAGKVETEQALAGKADVDGYYSQMTVGAADNLTGRGDTTTAEFLYRTAGGTADIETGQAVAKSVKGNTLVWNQLVREPNNGTNWPLASSTCFTKTLNQDNSVALTVADNSNTQGVLRARSGVNFVSGHKYLVKVGASGLSTSTRLNLLDEWAGCGSSTDAIGNTSAIITATKTASTYPFASITIQRGSMAVGDVVTIKSFTCFDLTQMFGAGNEPSTVAEFEALFPEPYYEYDAGSLLSVNMEGIETVGFNQWDEEWELGAISGTTGKNADVTNLIRSKNYIPVLPNAEYYFKCGSYTGQQSNPSLRFYDADKNFIGVYGTSGAITPTNSVFTVPANAHYLRFNMQTGYGTTYNHDICINLSWSGRRNGEYEPFWSSQREIAAETYFPDGMRSAGSVRDELTSTEAITRVGVVDLGTLEWTRYESSGVYAFRASLSGMVKYTTGQTPDLTCAKYPVGRSANTQSNVIANMPDKSISAHSEYELIFVRDDAYTDAATFKTAMSGVILYYELATPTVTPIDPPLNLSYRVDDFGTERVMVPEDERSAPPVLDIAYGLNVVDFVRRAPSEYMSHASMSQFRLALMSHFGIFINETWDEVDNRYEYTITSE